MYYISLTASYFFNRCIIYIILYIWRSVPWYELAGNHKTSELPSFMKFVDQSHFQLALLHRNHQHEDFIMSRFFYITWLCWQNRNCNYVWSRKDVNYKISKYWYIEWMINRWSCYIFLYLVENLLWINIIRYKDVFCFEQPVLMISFKLVFGNEDKGNGFSNSLTSHFSDAYFP